MNYETINVRQGFIQRGVGRRTRISPPQQDPPPPPPRIYIYFISLHFFGIFTSYLVSNFQPFWNPRSNLRAFKFQKFRGRGSTCIIFSTPTENFCMKLVS